VLGLFGRRAIDLAVLFLALYAFAFVPLGRRTGLEHVRAILRTHAAEDAGHELMEAFDHLKARLLGSDDPLPGRGVPVVPKLPRRRTAPTPPQPGVPANMLVAPRTARDVPDASL
jgi:hypothetical protein